MFPLSSTFALKGVVAATNVIRRLQYGFWALCAPIASLLGQGSKSETRPFNTLDMYGRE